MAKKYLTALECCSNGSGSRAYGGKIDAYSFEKMDADKWFKAFGDEVIAARGKRYLPVYRMADGEFRFLFGHHISIRKLSIRRLLVFLKYEIFKIQFKTSWGEGYDRAEKRALVECLIQYIKAISEQGYLALYWNENAIDAYTEYNHVIEDRMGGIGVGLSQKNYVPFHFCQGLLATRLDEVICRAHILVCSGCSFEEFLSLETTLLSRGAAKVTFVRCSKTNSLRDDFSQLSLGGQVDIAFVAAGIGSAKVLCDFRMLSCPVLDIGSYIHVLSGRAADCHGGFFVAPK